ncbi:MAG: type II secretion system protein J [Pyrinomonadaceae bacterium]
MKKIDSQRRAKGEAGFSLLELIIAMGLTVIVLGVSTALLASAVRVRAREDRRSDAIAEVRRALNTMTREISNAGYQLPANRAGNGIVAANSNSTSIRVVTNPDRFSTAPGATPDYASSQDEDVIYRWVDDPASDQSYILRYDVNSTIQRTTVLANRIDSFIIRYYDRRVTYQAGTCQQGINTATVLNSAGAVQAEVPPAQATYVVIATCVQLPAVGTPGSEGYQPPSQTQLISDVQMRNAAATSY